MKYTEAFAVPGETDSVIDVRDPDTGLSSVYGETLEQIQARYPGAVIVDLDAWIRAKAERQHTPIQWEPSTEKQWWYMLEVLPPAEMIGGAFLVGEPVDADASNGRDRFQAYRQRGRTFEAASRPMTRAEFRREMGVPA